MRKARILIVDDSTVIRRLLSDALVTDPAVEIAGTAANGKIALSKLPQVNPDLVTLDMEMPEMDGLTTLKELRKQYPRLPVVMFSTLTQKGASATINALSLGASDYVTKPANVGGVTAAIEAVKNELLPKIKALCNLAAPIARPTPSLVPPPKKFDFSTANRRFDILAIGVSTGGPNALTEIFRTLPAKLPVPIVIVQHMPPVFTGYLAERLNSVSQVDVVEARAGMSLHPGRAYLAPGNFHLALSRTATDVVTRLHQAPPENSCRPAVDVLFRSVAENYGSNTLAAVLTGMGQDGQRGCEFIRAAGGFVLAQDEASSVVWGMPGAVVQAGLASSVLPLPQIAGEFVRLANLGRNSSAPRPLVPATV